MNKLIALVIILVFALFIYKYPYAMINPGELVEGHQDIKEKCFSCHIPFGGISNDKCISCHKISDIGIETTGLQKEEIKDVKIHFHQNILNQKCSSCHTDHKGLKPELPISSFDHKMLSKELVNQCSSCHNKPTDHIHQHISATCNSCHNTIEWKTVVAFNHNMIQGSEKNNCISCHQPPSDSYHHLFKENCDRCHTTKKWLPSTFNHSSYFQLDENHNTDCNTCHSNNNFSTYTCYGCHEHSRNKMMEEHTEEGISNFTNCISCHGSANKHDIRTNGRTNNELKQIEQNGFRKQNNYQEKENQQKHNQKKSIMAIN